MDRESGPAVTGLRIAALSERHPNRFRLAVDDQISERIREDLGLVALRRLRLSGDIRRSAGRSWTLEAGLGATVVQPCVVTLEPVTTRIDLPVLRRYSPDAGTPPDGAETEISAEDDSEPLPAEIDLVALAAEALALALPDYPRAEGAELGQSDFAGPGIRPMTDADAHPFAALAQLRKPPGQAE